MAESYSGPTPKMIVYHSCVIKTDEENHKIPGWFFGVSKYISYVVHLSTQFYCLRADAHRHILMYVTFMTKV